MDTETYVIEEQVEVRQWIQRQVIEEEVGVIQCKDCITPSLPRPAKTQVIKEQLGAI